MNITINIGRGTGRWVTPWFFAIAAMFGGAQAFGAAISASDVFLALEQASINDTGDSTTPVLFIGADNVVPNGSNGTTGTATSSDLSISNYSLLNTASTAFPNQISTGIGAHAIPYDGSNPNLLNPWTLTFINPGLQPTVVQTPSSAGFNLPAFANTVTITGGTTTPTISWAGTGNGVFVNIVNKNQCADGTPGTASTCGGHGGLNTILSVGNLAPTGSLQIPGASGSFPGLTPNGSYQIQVAEVNTRDGSTNTVHHNEAAISRALFDYAVSSNTPQVPINIPMADSSGVFHFNISVAGGALTYIDPPITTGYIYDTGIGDPNFASVMLPVLANQTDPYEIEWDNGLDTAFVSGGQTFDFPGMGVSEFEVTGIDVANGLDPTDPTAFITALTFESSGSFTGTMTAIITSAPEPSSMSLLATAFLVTGVWLRRRSTGRSRCLS